MSRDWHPQTASHPGSLPQRPCLILCGVLAAELSHVLVEIVCNLRMVLQLQAITGPKLLRCTLQR